jgi:hypothetical protein
MPADNELEIATISGVIYPSNPTRFMIVPPATTTKLGSIPNNSTQLTVNNTTGITTNLYVNAVGIQTGTQVSSIVGNVVTLSKTSTEAFSGRTIVFYTNSTDGLLPLKVGQTIKFLA